MASPNFPNDYGTSESCEIVAPERALYITQFETESSNDFLTINGQNYSGLSGPLQGTISFLDVIRWNSNSADVASGWQICTAFGLKLG